MYHFRPAKSSDLGKIIIQNDPTSKGCWSQVGKQNGTQKLQLSPGCNSTRVIQHELFHSMGIYHEQSRPDRDNFIEIHKKCIEYGKEHNFKKQNNSYTYGLEYNPKSIMHYWSRAFSKWCKTITSKVTIVSILCSIAFFATISFARFLVYLMMIWVLQLNYQTWTMKR